MVKAVKSYLYKFLKASAVALAVLVLAALFIGNDFLIASVSAFLLSFLFVASNFVVIAKVNLDDHSQFYRAFFISLAVRFLFIIGALVIVLGVINFIKFSLQLVL